MPKPLTLRLCLIEQALPPQLDFLISALDRLRPPGDAYPVPDEMLVETRRVFADLRRLVAGSPVRLADPVGPLTRGKFRPCLVEALKDLLIFKEEQRLMEVARRRNAMRDKRLQERRMSLSPRHFPDIE